MFKAGDKVVCIHPVDRLKYGKVYTVLDVGEGDIDDFVVIDMDGDGGYYPYYQYRFINVIIVPTEPTVTITEEEYHSLIEEVNMLQELVAELYKEKEPEVFKPISEYTIDDWKQALREGWVFMTEQQGLVIAREIECDIVLLQGGEKGDWWVDMPSGIDTDGEGYTVVKRIK